MKEETLTGIAIGAGLTITALLAKTALSGESGRALLRSTIKSGLLAYEKSRETLAEVAEDLEDIVVEVQDELRAEKARTQAKEPSTPPPADQE
ncbi:MAG: DUF5132 domain-containing protein [Methylohalobius sp. ZOD2]